MKCEHFDVNKYIPGNIGNSVIPGGNFSTVTPNLLNIATLSPQNFELLKKNYLNQNFHKKIIQELFNYMVQTCTLMYIVFQHTHLRKEFPKGP